MHMIKKIELKKAKLILVSLLILSFLIPLISAISIGTFKRNEPVELYQTCNNCTYCNITSIKYPNSSNMFTNLVMNQQGTYYYWVLGAGNTTELGTYTYCYECGNTVEKATGCIEFEVTPSGFSGTLGFYIIIITIGFLILLLGFYLSDEWVVILGTLILYFVGIFILVNGIAGIQNKTVTLAIGLVIVGLASYISIRTALEIIQSNY